VLSLRRGLDKYASNACRLAVDAHDARNGVGTISRQNKRAPTRLVIGNLVADMAAQVAHDGTL
jgi:hypothetical protein